VSRPAPAIRSVSALALHELRLTARRGENVLVTLVIPVAVLWFFASTAVLPSVPGERVDFLLPGSIAMAVVAAGFVNLGIATAYERSHGVLKRLGGAPLPRWGLVAAKIAAVLVLELLQVALLVVVAALLLDWAPGPHWAPALAVVAVLLGTLAFAGLGLLLAGTLRAETTLALTNGLFLAFVLLGGLILPVADLPSVLQPLAAILPATSLADLLRIALDTGLDATTSSIALWDGLLLAAWGAVASGLAIRSFRWE
jgi:ABC-2 type transport system permease protein